MRVGDLNQYPSTSPITTHPGVKNINAQKKAPKKYCDILEFSAKHEQIGCVLFRALSHFLSSVSQLVEAVVDVSYQLSAG